MWHELFASVHYGSCVEYGFVDRNTCGWKLSNEYFAGARYWCYNILKVNEEIRGKVALYT